MPTGVVALVVVVSYMSSGSLRERERERAREELTVHCGIHIVLHSLTMRALEPFNLSLVPHDALN